MRGIIYRRVKSLIPAGIMLVLLCVAFSLNAPYFFSAKNFLNIFMQMGTMSILAVGLTFVVIGGNLDLSGGSVISLVGVVCGLLLMEGRPLYVVLTTGLALGALIGAFNGVCVAVLKMPAFILTMATSIMVRGIAFALTGGSTISGLPESFLFLGSGKIFGFPVAVLLELILFALFWVVLARTIFGYHVYAVGENTKGAQMAGISDVRVHIETFTLAGVLYALAGIVLTGQLGAAVCTSGEDMEMTALACLAIGGVSLSGGRGSMAGTFLGCLIIGVLTSGLNFLNLSPYYTDFIRGLVIFGALLMESGRILLEKTGTMREENGEGEEESCTRQ